MILKMLIFMALIWGFFHEPISERFKQQYQEFKRVESEERKARSERSIMGMVADAGFDKKIQKRYFKVIYKNAIINNLDPILIARIIQRESGFHYAAHNGRTNWHAIAVGAMQVKPAYWGAHIIRGNPVLANRISRSKNPREDYIKYFKQIGYNVQVGTAALAIMIKMANGDIPLGLIAYNCGPYSWQYRKAARSQKFKNNFKYVVGVLQ